MKLLLGLVLMIGLSGNLFAEMELLSDREKEIAIYYYMNGWNSGINKVYEYEFKNQKEQAERIMDGSHFVPVGGFTGTDEENCRETIQKDQWDFKEMHYRFKK